MTSQDGALDWRSYAQQMATVQGYALDDGQLERVSAQLALVAQVAAPLLAIALPAEVEPVTVFQP